MESQAKLGTSLMVPSVKEIAKEQLVAIPPRYIRHDHDSSPVAHTSSSPQVPVIDMANLSASQELMALELHKFHYACKDWGFFQVKVFSYGLKLLLLSK